MWCLSAMERNWAMRFLNPCGSCFQATLCRNTRIVLNPMLSAQPNSRSMVVGSNVSACHISSWLIAVLGTKLAPVIHLCWLYHCVAFSAGQMVPVAGDGLCCAGLFCAM